MMDEPENPDESPDESLANISPAPVPASRVQQAAKFTLGAIALTGVGGCAFLMVAGTLTPCMGATRSTRLEWEKRKLLIEQAEAELRFESHIEVPGDDRGSVRPTAAE
jgi:hypothetical protein